MEEEQLLNTELCQSDDVETLKSENLKLREIAKQFKAKNISLLQEVEDLKRTNTELTKSNEDLKLLNDKLIRASETCSLSGEDDNDYEKADADIHDAIDSLIDLIDTTPISEFSMFVELDDLLMKIKRVFGPPIDNFIQNNKVALLNCISKKDTKFSINFQNGVPSETSYESFLFVLKKHTQMTELNLTCVSTYWNYTSDSILCLTNLTKLILTGCIIGAGDVQILLRILSGLHKFNILEISAVIINNSPPSSNNNRLSNSPGNHVMNTFTKLLDYVPQLTTLKISGCNVPDGDPIIFSRHQNLKYLVLTGLTISFYQVLDRIKYFTSLEGINLSNNCIDGQVMVKLVDNFKYLPKLNHIIIDKNNLNSKDIDFLIEKYPSVPTIKYIKNPIGSDGVIINKDFAAITIIPDK